MNIAIIVGIASIIVIGIVINRKNKEIEDEKAKLTNVYEDEKAKLTNVYKDEKAKLIKVYEDALQTEKAKSGPMLLDITRMKEDSIAAIQKCDNEKTLLSSKFTIFGDWYCKSVGSLVIKTNGSVIINKGGKMMYGRLALDQNAILSYNEAGSFSMGYKITPTGDLAVALDQKQPTLLFMFQKLAKAVTGNLIQITGQGNGCLNLGEITILDDKSVPIPLTKEMVTIPNPHGSFPASNLIDNNETTFGHNDCNARIISIKFPKPVIISAILVANRKDCCKTRANGLIFTIDMVDSSATTRVYQSDTVKDWSGSSIYENGGTDAGQPLAYNYITCLTDQFEPIISNTGYAVTIKK